MRQAITLITLFFILASSFGCDSSTGGKQNATTKPRETNVVPLRFGLSLPTYSDARTVTVEERILPAYWDVYNGRMSFANEASPAEKKLSGDRRFVETSTGLPLSDRDGVNMPPLPTDATNPCQLLLSGSPEDYLLLVGYDKQAKDGAGIGGLILGRFKNEHMEWRDINGFYPSPNAAYAPDVVRVDDRIYLDGKGGLDVKVIDLEREPLEVGDYRLAKNLIKEVKDIGFTEPPPVNLGSYEDILLISVGGSKEIWTWALQNDECVGKLCLKPGDMKMVSYRADGTASERSLPAALDWIGLPE